MTFLLVDQSPSTVFFEGIGCLICWYIYSSTVTWYRLRHIPGPFVASFSYLWIASVTRSGRQYEIYRDLRKKYDVSLVRVGPNDLTTDDPDIIRRVSSAKGDYRKGQAYTGNRFNPYIQTMFTILDPVEHDKAKAKVAAAYSGRETPALESDVDEQLRNMVDLIRRKYLSKAGEVRTLPLDHTSALFTLDVISKVSLGDSFGGLQKDADIHEFLSTLKVHIPFMALTIDLPWLRNIFYSDTFLKLMGPKETDPHGMGRLMGLTNNVVRERFAPDAKPQKDMLGSFMRHGLTQQDCEGETLFMFVAGSETTAAVIRVTMLHILSNPRVYHKLKEEIRQAIVDGKVSDPITNAEGRALPYLQVRFPGAGINLNPRTDLLKAVIYEGLRIRPVVSGLMLKEVPAGGDTIDGKFIPAGTCIGTNLPSFLRSKVVFGNDADIFRPERFLELDPDALAEMHRSVEMQFGYGRWMCAGRPLAQMELNKVYFELLRNFDFQIIDPQNPMTSKSYLLWIDEGLAVRATESDIPREAR